VSEPTDGELESAAEMTAAVRSGEVTAVELVGRSLRRAERWQPWTNAFSQVWADRALRRAAEIDPGAPGPLAGVPVTIKDLFDIQGEETTGCCRAYRGHVADRDATVAARVLAAGAIPIGKTNQHELAAGGTNLVSACGRTGNPWDPDRMTGGSSGGAGITVATGIVPMALGSDTGGSVRIPSSMCGTFGLKPTTGSLPLDGVMPLAPSMDCPGPLASTVRDLATLYGVMAGSNPSAPTAPSGNLVRIAPVRGFFAEDVHPECVAAVDDSVAVLAGRGMAAGGPLGEDDESRGVLYQARAVWNRICFPEFARAHQGIDRQLVSDQPRLWMERGEWFTQDELEDAARRRETIRAWFLRQLEQVDALAVPTCAYPAPRADEDRVEVAPGRFVEVEEIGPGWLTCTVNLAGLPALSLPAARSHDGLPIGVSLIGRPNEEGTLLALAALWERGSGYRPTPPSLPTSDPLFDPLAT
jgi:aspartyl-tRNA(Asn)/glutamyl-tRNA(Gln) amidotransferase subunit A